MPKPNKSYFDAVRDLRNAIDRMELTMMGVPEILDLPKKWGEPPMRPDATVTIKLTAAQVYDLCAATAELNRLVHSEDHQFA